MTTYSAECVLRSGSVLAEGPVWDIARRRLWWVDIERMELHCSDPCGWDDRAWTLADRIGFAVPTTRGDLIIGEGNRLARFNPDSGAVTVFCSVESEPAENRFNDAKCDSAGRLWAGTMAVSEAPARGRLHRIEASGRITQMLASLSISNGLAWSSDGRTMYHIDSPTGRVDAFDFEHETGAIENRRTVVRIEGASPDGMCIDNAGHLWVALWGGWGVACFDPATGAQVAKIEVPVEAVTSCCFGGEDGGDLFITTASRDVTAANRDRQPLAGSIFVVRPDATGAPPHLFAG